jgi:hypothetical protein
MSRHWGRRRHARVRSTMISVLVVSVVGIGVPAFAGETPSQRIDSTISTGPIALRATSIADVALREMRAAFDRPTSGEERRLASAAQGASSVEKSGHWCAGGLALLAGGVAAAVISGTRRDYNAQKPSPPVGVVLGTGAAVVGGIEVVRSCRH